MPAVVYATVLAVSSVPGDRLDTGLPAWTSYVGHAVEYGALGATLRWAADGARRPALLTVAVGALCGALDELWQSTVAGRHSSLVDLAVDVAAVTVAAIVTGRVTESS